MGWNLLQHAHWEQHLECASEHPRKANVYTVQLHGRKHLALLQSGPKFGMRHEPCGESIAFYWRDG